MVQKPTIILHVTETFTLNKLNKLIKMIIITVYQKRDLSTNKNFLQDKLFTGQMYNFVYKRDLLRAFPTKIRIKEVYKNDLFFHYYSCFTNYNISH